MSVGVAPVGIVAVVSVPRVAIAGANRDVASAIITAATTIYTARIAVAARKATISVIAAAIVDPPWQKNCGRLRTTTKVVCYQQNLLALVPVRNSARQNSDALSRIEANAHGDPGGLSGVRNRSDQPDNLAVRGVGCGKVVGRSFRTFGASGKGGTYAEQGIGSLDDGGRRNGGSKCETESK